MKRVKSLQYTKEHKRKNNSGGSYIEPA